MHIQKLLENCCFCYFNKSMEYEWDEGKREANLIKHGVDFTEVYNFQWEKAQIKADTRIIGLRKANKREKMTYENKT